MRSRTLGFVFQQFHLAPGVSALEEIERSAEEAVEVGVASTMVISVLERRGEIGLRRSLAARRGC